MPSKANCFAVSWTDHINLTLRLLRYQNSPWVPCAQKPFQHDEKSHVPRLTLRLALWGPGQVLAESSIHKNMYRMNAWVGEGMHQGRGTEVARSRTLGETPQPCFHFLGLWFVPFHHQFYRKALIGTLRTNPLHTLIFHMAKHSLCQIVFYISWSL